MKAFLTICLCVTSLFILNSQSVIVLDEENGIFYDEGENALRDESDYYDRNPVKLEHADYIYVEDVYKSCVHVNKEFTPNKIVRKDCPGGDIGAYEFTVSVNCPTAKWCKFSASIYFNGKFIKSVDLSGQLSNVISGDYSEFDLTGIDTPSEAPLRVVIYEFCDIYRPYGGGGPYTRVRKLHESTDMMTIRGPGETYTISQFLGAEVIYEHCVEDETTSEHKLCCNPARSKLFRLDNIEQQITTIGGNVSLTLFDVKWKINDNVSLFNFSNSYSWSHSHSYSNVEVIREDFTLNANYGECVFPGFQLYARRYLVTTYEVDCDTGYDIPLSEVTEEVPFKIEPFECHIPPSDPSSCGNPQIIIDSGNNLHVTQSCSGYISVIPTGEDPDDYSYYWTGPDGFESTDQSLYNVSLGQYNLFVTNSCCEGIDTTIYLCNGISYGPWTYDSETGQYCREVSCDTCEDAVASYRSPNVEIYTECVFPSYGPYFFNESTLMCEREVLLGDEVLSVENSIPEIIDDFDDFLEICTRTYYCNGSEQYSLSDDPEFEEWQYDEFFDECYREVICFGSQVPDYEQQADADLAWNYNDFWEECEAVVYCDDDETDIVINEEPEVDWSFDEFFYECEATVYCDGQVVDQYETEPELVDFEYDDFFNLCELDVTCDGSVIFNYTTSISGGEIVGQDDEGNDLCEPYCAGEPTGVVVLCSDIDGLRGNEEIYMMRTISLDKNIRAYPNPFTTSIAIEHLPGKRILKFKMYEMTSTKEVMNKTMISNSGQARINIDASIPNGIYLLTIEAGNEILFRERFIKL